MQIRKWMPWYPRDTRHPAHDTPQPWVGLHGDLDQLFEQMLAGFGVAPPAEHGEPFKTGLPRVSLDETDDEVRVEVELPGMDEKDVELILEDDHLVITGRVDREEDADGEQGAPKGLARYAASFRRVIPLRREIDRDKVDATLDKGVLTVVLPKTADSKQRTRHIAVHGV